YRDAETGEFFDQVEARSTFFDVGHMAKAVHNLMNLVEYVDADGRERVMSTGRRFGDFVLQTPRTATGWLPRRVGHDLKPYSLARLPPQIGPDAVGGLRPVDPVADRSGAGLLT